MLVSERVVSLLVLEILFSSLLIGGGLDGMEMQRLVLGLVRLSVAGWTGAVFVAEGEAGVGSKGLASFLAPLCIWRGQYF